MAQPEGKCPRCGADVAHVQAAGEYILVAKDGRIRGSQRHFHGHCPIHGKVLIRSIMGHHGSYTAAQLKRRYGRGAHKKIKDRLTPHQRVRFKRALAGWIHPKSEEVRLWDHLARTPWLSKSADWLANVRFKPTIEQANDED